jgi:hypothetical protein
LIPVFGTSDRNDQKKAKNSAPRDQWLKDKKPILGNNEMVAMTTAVKAACRKKGTHGQACRRESLSLAAKISRNDAEGEE